MKVIVVGAGALGTMHAWHAVRRGHEVVHLEREPEARGASVRNFGLVWVGGRSVGPDLDTALRARQLWGEIAAEVPGLGFRASGSLTVVRTEAEWAVAAEAVARPDAAVRGWELLDEAGTRKANPLLRGPLLGALWSPHDAQVDPRGAQRALQAHLTASGRYTLLTGREVREVVGENAVRDDHGEAHVGDVVFLCTGAWLGGLVRELAPRLPVRRVRLQMMQTDPIGEHLPTSVADGDSFRYYPAYQGPALDALNAAQPQHETASAHRMQLLLVQRGDGSLTIGDTHEYDQPFAFDTVDEPYAYLQALVEELLGRPVTVRRRWAGVYAQCLDPGAVLHRERVREGVWLVTGPGGRGMTGSPAMAEKTIEEAGL
ncbi:TIGR03364 family FAD-dependent oxidoreductase [Streptacidiphilus monticola]|uniref:TIGR03364 family FAD-dependent oxidoreductase n=1 Tax=Streptacidiphilus monticola TaxID=2161674 RepID=A0ABW1FZ24_9ACTN